MENRFFVHPLALCESTAIGDRTRIWPFAHVMSGATLGSECNVGDHAFVESGATLGDRVTVKNNVMIWEGVVIESDVFLGPGMMFTNDLHPRSPRMTAVDSVSKRYGNKTQWLAATRVCQGASIGAGAILLGGITIGAYALVGAGAVVRQSVAPHALMVGNPAKQKGWVCHCAGKLQPTRDNRLQCQQCNRPYALVDQRPVEL
jgi:UDP-2-acetamido-3-amino-2,3-dideoxy-glucuronate N-acetyltransferase